jgi:hypothetical protein
MLGLTLRDASGGDAPVVRTPERPPLVGVVKVMGKSVRVRVSDRDSLRRRGKPAGIAGAAVFTAAGDLPPAKLADWSFQANITRPLVDVHFDAEVPAGGKVWIMAFWYNPRGQRGPASMPVCTRVGDGVSNLGLRLAA